MRVNDRLRMEFMAECLGKRPVFLVQERPWSPSLSTSFSQRHSVLSKILAPVRKAIVIRSSSGLRKFPTLAIGKASDQAVVWLFCAVSSWQWFQGLGVSSSVASASLQLRSSQAYCVPFVVGMNHEVRTRRQLRWLLPHEAMWEREATCWRGPGRQRTTIRNMAETGLWQNGGQDLHVGLAGMLVTSYLFQKSHCVFFPCVFLLRCQTPQAHGALRNRYVSSGVERQFFKIKNAWCGSISSRFSVMLSSTFGFCF